MTKREWESSTEERMMGDFSLCVTNLGSQGWYWKVGKDGATIHSGLAPDRHLAKTYAVRAAKKLLGSLGR